MYKKTTSIQCAKYCDIYNVLPVRITMENKEKSIKCSSKSVNSLFQCDYPVYIQKTKGIVGILFSLTGEADDVQLFVIHRTVKIKKGVYFNYFSLTDSGTIKMYSDSRNRMSTLALSIPFIHKQVRSTFEIDEIFAYYYSARGNSYQFEGEEHQYWELTYVDNGELICTVDGESYVMPPRTMMFFAPHQFHTQKTNSDKSCSYLTIMFAMNLKDSKKITHRVLPCQKEVYSTLITFIQNASDKNDSNSELLLCLMKQLVIYSMQNGQDSQLKNSTTPMQQHFEDELLNEVINFIKQKIDQPITVVDICDQYSISRSTLQALFKRNLNTSPKYYINSMKLERSKILLKNSTYTVSQISEKLGYASIHYFSRKFKQEYGISPSEYSKSIVN